MTTTNRPTYGVYQVEEGKNDRKGFWTKVGAAWPHEKGDGFSIKGSFAGGGGILR